MTSSRSVTTKLTWLNRVAPLAPADIGLLESKKNILWGSVAPPVAQAEIEPLHHEIGTALDCRHQVNDVHHALGVRARNPFAVGVETVDVAGGVDRIDGGANRAKVPPNPKAHREASVGDEMRAAVGVSAHLPVRRHTLDEAIEVHLAVDAPDDLVNADALDLRSDHGIALRGSDNDIGVVRQTEPKLGTGLLIATQSEVIEEIRGLRDVVNAINHCFDAKYGHKRVSV